MTKSGQSQDSAVVEPGPTPPNAERHGIWRILTKSLVLAVIALGVIGFVYL